MYCKWTPVVYKDDKEAPSLIYITNSSVSLKRTQKEMIYAKCILLTVDICKYVFVDMLICTLFEENS